MAWWKKTIIEEFESKGWEAFEELHRQHGTPYGLWIGPFGQLSGATDRQQEIYRDSQNRGYINQTIDEIGYGTSEEIKDRKFRDKQTYLLMTLPECQLYELGARKARGDAKKFRMELRRNSR